MIIITPSTDEVPMSFRTNSCCAAEIPCYAAEIPCFSPEQGIHAYRIDMSRDRAAPAARKGANSAHFDKFPAKFPASRELRPAKAWAMSETRPLAPFFEPW
jgi:hypothetical protein